ncbi:MAG: CAP domain-containing protein [Polyangiales bacterium]
MRLASPSLHFRVSALALLVLGGCGPSAAPQRAATSIAASESTTPRPATRFESSAELNPLRGGAVDALLSRTLRQSCAKAGLVSDGRLAELAMAIARASDGAHTPPSYSLVSFHARSVGLAEPTPQVWLASGPDTQTLAPALADAIREASRTSRLTHCGASAVPMPGGVVVALALSTRPFAFARPVPRRIRQGDGITLVGELADGYHHPIIALTPPAGVVTRHVLGEDRDFSHVIPTPQAGTYTVELLAEGPDGLTVAAMFPVAVGIPLETRAPRFEDERVESNPEEVADHLLTLIAEERARRRLPPLRNDRRLTRIALKHSKDMVQHAFIAHTSKRSGDATARVRRAGLNAYVVLENIGRGYSADELHRGLMESPGHRGNILHPEAREIGIGVMAEQEGDRLAFIATELFTQLAPE